ncbi:MAG TPA: rhodanese-like domain-containing protein [Sandaracinaceae bacterium]
MKRASTILTILASVALSSACSGEANEAPIPELSVAQVASMLEAGEAVVVDANNARTREQYGVIPGARLLSSSSSYDPATELPADKSTNLVFYCGNFDCRASDGAAARAREAGYTRVHVMRAGIAGWVEAGREVARPQS